MNHLLYLLSTKYDKTNKISPREVIFFHNFLSSCHRIPVVVVIDHFTVVCLVAWPLNESEAGGDLVLIETLLLFICKFLLISMRTASLK